MFVSILQRMATGWLKPIQSRPDHAHESTGPEGSDAGTSSGVKGRRSRRSSGSSGGASALHALASPARRQELKPHSKETKPAAKAQKPVAKKSAKPAVGAPRTAARPASKVAAGKAAGVAKTHAAAKKLAGSTTGKSAGAAKPAKPTAAPPRPMADRAAKPVAKAVKPIEKPAAKAAVARTETAMPNTKATPAAAPRRSAKSAQAMPSQALPAVASTAAKSSYAPAAKPVFAPVPVARKDPKLAGNWKTKSAEELSDDEVIAMPDAEYMNEKQLAFFRLKLLQLKSDILNSADETTEHLREDTVVVPDPADRATIEEEHALELRTRDRERKLLKKIEQSIQRIDAGDYGYCDETGEPIGVPRLLARPTATLSLEAQQRRELKQKMFGD
ncbi:MAG: RNA polymerase-binding protein DksA [Proteobacteria bacterium]|nr:RNA polymerase-binding protein DksA [Pseudomonadota bacterium]